MIEVKAALLEQCREAAALLAQMKAEEGGALTMDQEIALTVRLKRDLLEKKGETLLAWDRNRPVGVVRLQYLDDFGVSVLVSGLYVKPDIRNQGVAHKLLEAAVMAVPYEDAPVYITTRGDLPRSYKRLGFVPYELTSVTSLKEARAQLLREDRDGVSVDTSDWGGGGPVRSGVGEQVGQEVG